MKFIVVTRLERFLGITKVFINVDVIESFFEIHKGEPATVENGGSRIVFRGEHHSLDVKEFPWNIIDSVNVA